MFAPSRYVPQLLRCGERASGAFDDPPSSRLSVASDSRKAPVGRRRGFSLAGVGAALSGALLAVALLAVSLAVALLPVALAPPSCGVDCWKRSTT